MILKVHSETRLAEIRSFIHEHFHFLDIAFFRSAHHSGEGNRRADMLPYTLTLSEAGELDRGGELLLEASTAVGDVESSFYKHFGLHAQFLRKSGDVWLQTTTSDAVSLADLNKQAQEANSFKPEKEEPGDYHEQE